MVVCGVRRLWRFGGNSLDESTVDHEPLVSLATVVVKYQ